MTINRIALGLLMLIPGLFKLLVSGPTATAGFLASLGFPISIFFAWILIISEILFGIAILANYRLKCSVIAPALIILVAAFTTALPTSNWPIFIMHIAIVTNYWVLATSSKE